MSENDLNKSRLPYDYVSFLNVSVFLEAQNENLEERGSQDVRNVHEQDIHITI